MRGFVKDYTLWIHHGETDDVAELDAQMDDDDREQGGDAGGWDGNDEGGAHNDGRRCVRDEDDGDCLEEMLRDIGPEIILKSVKRL